MALLTAGACGLLLASCVLPLPVMLVPDRPVATPIGRPDMFATAHALRFVSLLLQVAAVALLVVAPFADSRATRSPVA